MQFPLDRINTGSKTRNLRECGTLRLCQTFPANEDKQRVLNDTREMLRLENKYVNGKCDYHTIWFHEDSGKRKKKWMDLLTNR